MDNTTKWKKKFRDPPPPPSPPTSETAFVKGLSRIKVPPLQSVFDMPSSSLPNLSLSVSEQEEETKEPPVVVESMITINEIKKPVETLWNSIKSFRSLIKDRGFDILTISYEEFFNWLWVPVSNILPIDTSTDIIQRDTEFILTVIILFHIILIIIFASYNWYYILFDKVGNSHPADLIKKLNSFENSYLFQPLYVISRPVSYTDTFFTETVKKMNLDFIPETCKLYMIIFLLFATCITLYEEYKNYIATISFPVLITILLWFAIISQILSSKQEYWVMFLFLITSVALVIAIIGIITGVADEMFKVFDHKLIIYIVIWGFFAAWAVKFFMENPPISIFIILFSIIAIGVIGVITYYMLPLAFFLIYGYLIAQSFFGYSRFEGKMIPSYSGYAKKMLDIDVGRLTDIPLLLVKMISGIPLLISMILFFVGVVLYILVTFNDWKEDRCLLITLVMSVISAFFCILWAFLIKAREFSNPGT